MEEKDSAPNQKDVSKEDTFAEPSEVQDVLLYWKVELHELLSGNRASSIIQTRGSASDYIKTLFHRSSNRIVARHYFVEAFNEILKEIPLIALSPSPVNHLLDLIVEFKPKNGFPAIVSYLILGGTGESNFTPVGGAVAFDLHRKTLETLGTYFEVAPIDNTDPAFLTYVEILRQQILNAKYRGYAAFELLKLEVLQPDSKEFKVLIDEHPDSLNELLLNLSMYASNRYGLEDIKTLFYVCLDSGKEVFHRLLDAIESSGSTLEPTEQEDPSYIGQTIETPTHVLRLFDGTAIPINLALEQIDLVYRYRYEDDTQDDVRHLLTDPSLTPAQRETEITRLFTKSCMLHISGIELFVEELRRNGARLIIDWHNNRIYVKHKEGGISINLGDVQPIILQTYIAYIKHSKDIPSDPHEINKTINETVKEREKAFVAVK